MSDPLFSVIIPTYSRPHFLAEAIASLMAQDVRDFECIVVDDASPHAPAVPDDGRFRLIRLPSRSGPAAARNEGLQAARGRYVSFLDDDDVFASDRLALALEGLDRSPVAVCWSAFFGELQKGGRILEGDVADSILDSITPPVGATSIWRECVPEFDPGYLSVQDVEWWLRLALQARVTTVPRVGYLVRRHEGPRILNGRAQRVMDSFRLLQDHATYFAAHPVAHAFRWKRIGLMAQGLGHHAAARRAFARSLRLHPDSATAWHLIRSVRPSTESLEDSSVAPGGISLAGRAQGGRRAG